MVETFTIIDPTNGRTIASNATAEEVSRHAGTVARCREVVLVVKNDTGKRPQRVRRKGVKRA